MWVNNLGSLCGFSSGMTRRWPHRPSKLVGFSFGSICIEWPALKSPYTNALLMPTVESLYCIPRASKSPWIGFAWKMWPFEEVSCIQVSVYENIAIANWWAISFSGVPRNIFLHKWSLNRYQRRGFLFRIIKFNKWILCSSVVEILFVGRITSYSKSLKKSRIRNFLYSRARVADIKSDS